VNVPIGTSEEGVVVGNRACDNKDERESLAGWELGGPVGGIASGFGSGTACWERPVVSVLGIPI
jgi:hypothetical protein